ncbi:hypothetical protein PpBr36_07019 [Pyricularia pennisetigena]|uniref:hypothetical protein n=1 Tax=Pyricularia pennisetigena TaxID=1578925 RepID=UPI001152633C|nr:hypothetical protein PpBr36_07019 [Pyricularia pennisetigena]TLS25093.1 hypothetical protein PpBr36_07019 [Pyricularia pennisetigena]
MDSATPITTGASPSQSTGTAATHSVTSDTASSTRTLLQPAMDFIRVQSRELRSSLRLQRDIFVDGWTGRFDDMSVQIAEDKRQVRAHVCRVKYAVRERLENLKEKRAREKAGAPKTFPQFSRLPAEIRLQIWQEALPGSRAVVLRSPYTATDNLLAELRLIVPQIRRRGPPNNSSIDDGSVVVVTADDNNQAATDSSTATTHMTPSPTPTNKPTANTSSKLLKTKPKTTGWTSSTPPPALLHACHESRTVALKRYELVLGCEDGQARIYADLNQDVICLLGRVVSPRCAALWRQTTGLDRIRHLAVAGCSWSSTHGITELFARRLPPPELLRSGFTALEDVAVVRSVRWQYGRLPGGAARDYDRWAREEKAAEGMEMLHTMWRSGVMVLSSDRKSIEDQDQARQQQQQQADGQVDVDL